MKTGKWNRIVSMLVLLFYALECNFYFGNNLTPQSPEECICDGFFCLGMAIIFLTRDK